MARGEKGQIAPEAVLIAGVMLFLLLATYAISVHLSRQWDGERQRLQASVAANNLARAINLVAAGGHGTSLYYFKSAGPDVANMGIYHLRSLRANYTAGGFASVPLVTNETNTGGSSIPLNAYLWLNNTNGRVYIAGA